MIYVISDTGAITKMIVHKIIEGENMIKYSDLMDYLIKMKLEKEYSIAKRNRCFFAKYLSSRRRVMKSETKRA